MLPRKYVQSPATRYTGERNHNPRHQYPRPLRLLVRRHIPAKHGFRRFQRLHAKPHQRDGKGQSLQPGQPVPQRERRIEISVPSRAFADPDSIQVKCPARAQAQYVLDFAGVHNGQRVTPRLGRTAWKRVPALRIDRHSARELLPVATAAFFGHVLPLDPAVLLLRDDIRQRQQDGQRNTGRRQIANRSAGAATRPRQWRPPSTQTRCSESGSHITAGTTAKRSPLGSSRESASARPTSSRWPAPARSPGPRSFANTPPPTDPMRTTPPPPDRLPNRSTSARSTTSRPPQPVPTRKSSRRPRQCSNVRKNMGINNHMNNGGFDTPTLDIRPAVGNLPPGRTPAPGWPQPPRPAGIQADPDAETATRRPLR